MSWFPKSTYTGAMDRSAVKNVIVAERAWTLTDSRVLRVSPRSRIEVMGAGVLVEEEEEEEDKGGG